MGMELITNFRKNKGLKTNSSYIKRVFSTASILLITTLSNAQDLTISSSGETGTTGTNWSITGNELTVTGTATVRASVIANLLATGNVVVKGNSTIFNVTLSEAISNAATTNSITIGEVNNTGIFFVNAAISLGGDITLNSGSVDINANIISTIPSGQGIQINTKKIIQTANATVSTQGANISYNASQTPFLSTSDNAILINGSTAVAKATINANGGNIYINATFASIGVEGTGANPDRAISLIWTDIKTSGQGTITINGDATNVTNTTASAWGIQMSNCLIQNVSGAIEITGTGGKATNNCRGIGADVQNVKILSQSGAITINELKPIGLTGTYNGLYIKPNATTDSFIGADGSIVASSSSPIIIKADKIDLLPNTKMVQLNTSGAVTFESNASSFEALVLTGMQVSGNPSSFTFGKSSNTATVNTVNPINVAGPITIYAGLLRIENTITSSNTGDITLISNTSNLSMLPSIYIFADILKTGGQRSKLTIRGGGRVQYVENRKIEATNAILDVIFWSDYDNSNNDGGTTVYGDIITNGGHVWLGGSNSNNGSVIWNGLTVGDGPSIGTAGSTNWNALDLGANITSAGGDVLIWSGDGYTAGNGYSGIQLAFTNKTINAGTGNITIITNSGVKSFTLALKTIGKISIAPNTTAFTNNPFVFNGTFSGANFIGSNSMDKIKIDDFSLVSEFNLGYYSNANGWNFANTGTLTINSDINTNGSVRLNANTINLNANLKTQTSGNLHVKGNTTVAAGKHIQCAGNFTQDGTILFKSDATATASFGTLGGTYTTTSGTVTVERFIPGHRAYRFLSPSVTTTTSIKQNWQENGGSTLGLGTHITGTGGVTDGFDPTETNNPSLFTFTNGAWSAVTNTNINTLVAGTPYRLMVRGDRTISMATNTPTPTATVLRATGTLKTGNFTPIINQTADGLSFIGNPYQAPVDIKAVLNSASNMNTTVVYYWDPTLNTRGGFVTRTLATNTNDVTSNFNEYLQPGQAVIVKRDNTTNVASMTFTESNKSVNNAAAGVFRNANSNEYGTLRVNLQANTNNQWTTIEGTLALFNDDFSWDVTSEDATKMTNLDEEVSFVQNNTSLAIALQSNPSATSELPIKIGKMRHTNYQWKFELDNYDGAMPYLFDTLNNSYTQINNGTVVPFTADANTINRFKIVFQNAVLSNATFQNTLAIYPNPAKAGASFYVDGISEATVTVSNLLGQTVPVQTKSQGTTLQVTPSTSLSKGVYLVNITGEGNTQQVKWIVE